MIFGHSSSNNPKTVGFSRSFLLKELVRTKIHIATIIPRIVLLLIFPFTCASFAMPWARALSIPCISLPYQAVSFPSSSLPLHSTTIYSFRPLFCCMLKRLLGSLGSEKIPHSLPEKTRGSLALDTSQPKRA